MQEIVGYVLLGFPLDISIKNNQRIDTVGENSTKASPSPDSKHKIDNPGKNAQGCVVASVTSNQTDGTFLGETLQQAVELVVSNEKVQDQLKKLVNVWMRSRGFAPTIQALSDYLDKHGENPSPLRQELCLLAQGEMDRLRIRYQADGGQV